MSSCAEIFPWLLLWKYVNFLKAEPLWSSNSVEQMRLNSDVSSYHCKKMTIDFAVVCGRWNERWRCKKTIEPLFWLTKAVFSQSKQNPSSRVVNALLLQRQQGRDLKRVQDPILLDAVHRRVLSSNRSKGKGGPKTEGRQGGRKGTQRRQGGTDTISKAFTGLTAQLRACHNQLLSDRCNCKHTRRSWRHALSSDRCVCIQIRFLFSSASGSS